VSHGGDCPKVSIDGLVISDVLDPIDILSCLFVCALTRGGLWVVTGSRTSGHVEKVGGAFCSVVCVCCVSLLYI